MYQGRNCNRLKVVAGSNDSKQWDYSSFIPINTELDSWARCPSFPSLGMETMTQVSAFEMYQNGGKISGDLTLPLTIHPTCPSTWCKGNKVTDSNVKTYEILIQKIANSWRKSFKWNGKYIQVVSSCETGIFYPPEFTVTRNSEDWTF